MATSGHSGILKIADLRDVKRSLWDARAKWRDIGSCIGVDEGTLDTMKGKDPGESLSDVLSHWLRGVHNPKEKNSKPRTWRTLIEALRDKVINEEAMADKLETEKPSDPDTNQDQCSDPPDVPSATHNLTFSSSMSDEDFSKWIRSKGISDKDCKTLSKSGITPSGFLQCDVEDFDDIGLTKIGKKLFIRIFTEVKGQRHDQQPSEGDHYQDSNDHEGSRGHIPQHPRQAEGRGENTVNDGGGGSAHGSSRAASAANTTSDNLPTLPTMLWILLPMSSQWMNIGTMLSLNHGRLTAIETRCRGAPDNCLREMLNEWLQQVNPRPTKSALVDAVEMYNPSLAEKISAL